MKLARVSLLGVALVLTSAAIPMRAQTQASTPALGLVSKALNSKVGDSPVAEGATIYSGDYLSTGDGGLLQVRIAALSLELQASSSAHIYRTPYGAIVELDRGTVVYSTPGSQSNLVIVGNDVRVTPVLAVADLGRVTINDPCDVTVYSQRGQADVRTGNESRTIEEGKAYRIRGDNEISYRKYVSPDDNDYHDYHGHKPCAAALQTVHGHAPVAAGSSHFLIAAGTAAAVLTVISVKEAFESPARP